MKNRKTVVFFFISLLLHSLIFFALKKNSKPKQVSPGEKIDIAIVEKKPPVKLTLNEEQNQKRSFPRTGKLQKGLPTLKNLLPNEGSSAKSFKGEGDVTLNDNVDSVWGSGGGDFARIKEYGLMSHIHHQVEGLLYYPYVLAAHKVEGNVNARLVLNTEGRCVWPSMSITSGNPYFRVFILDLLKKLCKQSYAHEVKGRGLTNVDMSFLFELSERDDQDIKEEQSHIVGNVLMFYRNSHQSVAQWRIGPFTGMFPIPFVSLDFRWLEEHWETYIEHKDALRDFHQTKDM